MQTEKATKRAVTPIDAEFAQIGAREFTELEEVDPPARGHLDGEVGIGRQGGQEFPLVCETRG